MFQTVTNNLINSKTALEKNNLRRSNIGGGVQGRYDRGQRFNVFFWTPSLMQIKDTTQKQNQYDRSVQRLEGTTECR